jgi:hypothetical protein
MNGDFHQDDGNMTILFFPGPSLNCGGEFELKLENNYCVLRILNSTAHKIRF